MVFFGKSKMTLTRIKHRFFVKSVELWCRLYVNTQYSNETPIHLNLQITIYLPMIINEIYLHFVK